MQGASLARESGVVEAAGTVDIDNICTGTKGPVTLRPAPRTDRLYNSRWMSGHNG